MTLDKIPVLASEAIFSFKIITPLKCVPNYIDTVCILRGTCPGEYMRKIEIVKQLEDELNWVVTQDRKGNLFEAIIKGQSVEVERK